MDFPHYRGEPKDSREWFEALWELARYLRTPDGCPWDREQSSKDFARFAQDEASEFLEAAESADDAHAAEEFGDTLFTLLAAAAAAEEEGRFRIEDALRGVHEKMIRRHEHVFGDVKAETPEDAIRVWNEVKEREKRQASD